MTATKLCVIIMIVLSLFPLISGGPEVIGAADLPQRISLATGSIGGSWYVLGGAWSRLINQKLNTQVSVEATKAGTGNVKLVHSKQSDFGVSSGVLSYEAYHGIGWASGTKYDKIRAVLPMTVGYFQWWGLARNNIRTISDLNGKIFCLSGAGSEADTFGRRIIGFFKVKPERIINAPHVQCGEMLRDNLIQVHAAFADIPHPAATELASRFHVLFIPFQEQEMAEFLRSSPYLRPGTIPPNTYRLQEQPVLTITTFNSLITHKDQNPDLVYAITKASFDTRESLLVAIKGATALAPEYVSKIEVPIHPGAIRYYKEIGLQISAALIPPEMK